MATPAQEMFGAASALMEAVERLRAQPHIQETIADYFLRALVASPEWRRMRFALKDWNARNGG